MPEDDRPIKTRSIFYRRAAWLEDVEDTLQQILRRAHQPLDTTESRTFGYEELELQGLRVANQAGFHLVHVGKYVPNEPAATLRNPSQEPDHDTSIQRPPRDMSYMAGEVFFAVRGNDVIVCTNNAHESIASRYIRQVLNAQQFGNLLSTNCAGSRCE